MLAKYRKVLLDLPLGLRYRNRIPFVFGQKAFGKNYRSGVTGSCKSHSFMCISTSARPRASAGTKGGVGRVASKYLRIAVDLNRTKPSSSSVGTRP